MSDPIAIYDGDCRICYAAVRWMRARNARGRCIPYQLLAPAELAALGLTADDCAAAMQVVRDRRVRSGAAAVNRLLRDRGGALAVAAAVADAVPPLLAAEQLCYRLFARRRAVASRLFGYATCTLPSYADQRA